jgi:hypothetical protein
MDGDIDLAYVGSSVLNGLDCMTRLSGVSVSE